MGGNALKHLNPQRLTTPQVMDVFNHLQRNWMLFTTQPLYLVPWVGEKQDHGDIDVVCEENAHAVRQFGISMGASPDDMQTNDTVVSVPIPLPWDPHHVVQVDFITCASENVRACRFFYSGGDFGLMLGRVAAWHGLVFGMDGLRYRADPSEPWQRDVLLTNSPYEILQALGYGDALPPFATYKQLWVFMLSSPMAKPWMFMPSSTNSENRSRDKQRKKVAEFQDWLREEFPENLLPMEDRKSPEEARDWVHEHFPHVRIYTRLEEQHAQFDYKKLVTRLFGMDAVEAVIDPRYPDKLKGDIVREMQAHLPQRAAREDMLRDAHGWQSTVILARCVAANIARERGIPVREAQPPLPAYVPPPK